MPGPKSSPKSEFKFPVGKPNRKSAARLKARQDAFPTGDQSMTKPGSQNRSK